MTFLEDFKNFIERAKVKFGLSWQKLLDQIPDFDRMDSYRFDDLLRQWVLKSTMPQDEPFILVRIGPCDNWMGVLQTLKRNSRMSPSAKA